jgi:hypothetical protein
MKPAFGYDFSAVRVNADAKAGEAARAANALAYSVGPDVVFREGQYAPQSDAARRLIAHELVHVGQQQRALEPAPGLRIVSPGDASEREAGALASKLMSHEIAVMPGITATEVQVNRQEDMFGERVSPAEKLGLPTSSTLPYREATELAACVRIMGDENTAYCLETVLNGSLRGPAPARTPSSLTVNPTEVQPRGTGGVETATVTVTGVAPGARVRPAVTAAANSGGHQHHNARPVGTIRPASRNADAAGQADFAYRSNVPAGVETITANVAGGSVQADIDVRVPGLVELLPGTDYDLVGQTAEHPDNHFGAAATVANLQQIAADYEAHKAANNLPAWPRIGYNDISLEHGGIFDINGDWAPPHRTHRVGQTLDFRTNHLNAAQRAVLRPVIVAAGATVLDEGNHWHLTF